MPDDHVCVMKLEFDHIKSDMSDIRATAKEQSKDMLSMRDSHIETKIFIRQIQESQSNMAQETKDNQKEMKENQIRMMESLQELKDKPVRESAASYKYYKVLLWGFGLTYVLGSLLSLVKTFAPKILGQ